MGILFTSVFWGIFLLLLGASILIKVFFKVDIPVFRIFFGLFFVFLGIKVLMGGSFKSHDGHETTFGETRVSEPKPNSTYDVVFGKGTLDLAGLPWSGADASLQANTVFGHTVLKLDPKIPTTVKVSAAFAGAKFPDGNLISFGEYTYRNKAYKEGKPSLNVRASVVFGGLELQD